MDQSIRFQVSLDLVSFSPVQSGSISDPTGLRLLVLCSRLFTFPNLWSPFIYITISCWR